MRGRCVQRGRRSRFATLRQAALLQALDNARFRSDNKTDPPDEIAVRFHHALVSVHPFPNGIGRWSRLMADLPVVRLGGTRLSWGGGSLRDPGKTRAEYIGALKAAIITGSGC